MPMNLVSPSTCTSYCGVDPSLHDAGSIGPGNCPGPTVSERGDPCYWTVYHDPDATGLPRSGPPNMSCCRGPKSGYKVLARNNPDRMRIVFDDHRSVANAGLLLPATLARHLGLGELVDRHLGLGGAPGGRPAPWAARSGRHPPWAPSCAASGGATSVSWTG